MGLMLPGFAILLCLTCFACREKEPVARQYSNGFFATKRDVSRSVSRHTLWHTVAGKHEQVAELLVVSNTVVSFMPTIARESSGIHGTPDIGAEIKGLFALGWASCGGSCGPMTIGISPDGPTINHIRHGKRDEKTMTPAAFSNLVDRMSQCTAKMISILEVRTPCPLKLFDEVISGLSRFSGAGISVIPAVKHIPVYVPYEPQSCSKEDIEVDIGDL